MLLREKDGNTFSHQFGDVRYIIGDKPTKVPNDVGKYLLSSFSAMLEEVPEPKKVLKPKVEPKPKPAPKTTTKKVKAKTKPAAGGNKS